MYHTGDTRLGRLDRLAFLCRQHHALNPVHLRRRAVTAAPLHIGLEIIEVPLLYQQSLCLERIAGRLR